MNARPSFPRPTFATAANMAIRIIMPIWRVKTERNRDSAESLKQERFCASISFPSSAIPRVFSAQYGGLIVQYSSEMGFHTICVRVENPRRAGTGLEIIASAV